MPEKPRTLLKNLKEIRWRFGPGTGEEKARLIRALSRRRLGTAGEVQTLHETLLFLRAFPDDEAVLAACGETLAGFARRGDLRRFRRDLADTGIAGTTMEYAFSYPMASWLARRKAAGARIDWKDWEHQDDFDALLPALAAPAEAPGVDDEMISVKEWLSSACAEGRSDYATLVDRFGGLRAAAGVREHLYNQLDVPARWDLGEGPDSRTLARWPVKDVFYQDRRLDRRRPSLRRAVGEAPVIRPLDEKQGARMVDLTRAAMCVRHRELEAFDYADPRDAWLAEAGRGLLIGLVGVRPERRLLPEALYAGLFIKNGIPLGYYLASALFRSSEVAFNLFPDFRRSESAWMYGRVLATLHRFLGATDFTVFRYQIGHDNEEAIASGAFWFYQKLGFRPRGREVLRLMREEVARLRADPSYRTPPAVLRRLVEENIFFHLGKRRDDLMGLFPYANLGHQVTRFLARLGSDPVRAGREAVRRAESLLGVRGRRTWPANERRAFEAWAPVVLLMKGVGRWSAPHRRGLVRILRAKGSRREVDFVRLSNDHAPFRRALQRLCV